MQSYPVTVKETISLSKNMKRVVLTGDSLKTFPNTRPGAYIKLMFDQNGNAVVKQPLLAPRPRLRTYTVRSFDKRHNAITIDFALHNKPEMKDDGMNSPKQEHTGGPASLWAERAKPGDKISFAGPGSSKPLADNYDWVLFAGDITALPSIESYLESLSPETSGFAFIQVPEHADIRPIKAPDKVKVIWLTANESIASKIAEHPQPEGVPAIWAACEFSEMRELRKLFTNTMQIPRDRIYISSYWKKGRSEEQHKVDKRNDQQLQMAS